MTREAAHHKVTTCRKNWSSKQLEKIEIVIDQIYDDFKEGIDKALKIAEENGYHDAYDLLMDIKENR